MFSIVAIINYHKLSGLNNIIYNLTVLEARNPKWVSQAENQGLFRAALPLEAPGEICGLAFAARRAACVLGS